MAQILRHLSFHLGPLRWWENLRNPMAEETGPYCTSLPSPKGPSRTKKTTGHRELLRRSVLLRPPDLLRCEPFFERRDACKTQGKWCPHNGLAIANHCAILNLLRVVNLLRRSIFSTAGSLGQGLDTVVWMVQRSFTVSNWRRLPDRSWVIQADGWGSPQVYDALSGRCFAVPEKCFQGFVSENLLLLLQDRPCLCLDLIFILNNFQALLFLQDFFAGIMIVWFSESSEFHLLDPPSPELGSRKRDIKLWHIKLCPVTSVTGPPGRVSGQKDLCSLGSEDST